MGEITEKTKEQFNKLAENYEKRGFWGNYFKHSSEKIVKIIYEEFGNNQKIRLLDLGSGTGTLLIKLSSYFPEARLVGVDISKEMVGIANQKLDKFKIYNVEFKIGDINNVDFKEQFDIITCLNSFHHYENHDLLIKKIYYALDNNGIIILLDPIKNGFLRGLWVRLLKNHFFDELYARYFLKSELVDIFRKNNMSLYKSKRLLYFIWVSLWKKNNE